MARGSLPVELGGKLKMTESADKTSDGAAQVRDLREEAEASMDAARKRRSKVMMRALREDMDVRPGVYEGLACQRRRENVLDPSCDIPRRLATRLR